MCALSFVFSCAILDPGLVLNCRKMRLDNGEAKSVVESTPTELAATAEQQLPQQLEENATGGRKRKHLELTRCMLSLCCSPSPF